MVEDFLALDVRKLLQPEPGPGGQGGRNETWPQPVRPAAGNLSPVHSDRSALKFCPICIKADQDGRRRHGDTPVADRSAACCPDHGVLLGGLNPPDYPRCPHDFAGRLADHRVLVGEDAVEAGGEGCAICAHAFRSAACPKPKHKPLVARCFAHRCGRAPVRKYGAFVMLVRKPVRRVDRKDLVAVGASEFAICVRDPKRCERSMMASTSSSRSTKGGFYADFGFYSAGSSG